MSTQSKNKAGK